MKDIRAETGSTPAQHDPWSDRLPDLLSLLDRLARNVVEESNESSLGFLGYLQDIETRVIEGNRATDSFLDRLGDVDRLAERHEEDRRGLDQALRDAIEFGAVVREEIVASRQALHSIAGAIGQMQAELVKVGRISKEIGLLSVNASIESARAGDAGRGFSVIAQSIRGLANDTQAITQRLNPLVEQVYTEVRDQELQSADAAMGDSSEDLTSKLTRQGTLLDDVAVKLATLSSDYAELIEVKRQRNRVARETGVKLEETIRAALASAQTGDIIRQQIELIIDVMGKVRTLAGAGCDSATINAALAQIHSDIAGSYVMKIQHDIHHASGGHATAPTSDDDLPSFEMF